MREVPWLDALAGAVLEAHWSLGSPNSIQSPRDTQGYAGVCAAALGAVYATAWRLGQAEVAAFLVGGEVTEAFSSTSPSGVLARAGQLKRLLNRLTTHARANETGAESAAMDLVAAGCVACGIFACIVHL